MSAPSTQVKLTIDAGQDADAEELARLAQQVRSGLLDLDAVESAELVRTGPGPDGSRGDAVQWGQVLISLVGAGGGLTAMIGFLQAWATRRNGQSATLEIDGDKLEITGLSDEGQKQLIRAFTQRHGKRD